MNNPFDLADSHEKLRALSSETGTPIVTAQQARDPALIEVGRFRNGFHGNGCDWCGWLRHHNITTTSIFENGDMVVYADAFNAKAVVGMQISDPARFGNCPAINKWMDVPCFRLTDYDRAFGTAFYAVGATWDRRVELNDAYMAGLPIDGISP